MANISTTEQINGYYTSALTIAKAVAGLKEEQLRYKPSADTWSIIEVIYHLADSETIVYQRIRRMIAENKPFLQPFDQAVWAEKLTYQSRDEKLPLDLFIMLRKTTADFLHSMPENAWWKKGVKPDKSEVTLYAVFISFLDHAAVHLRQIEEIKKSFKK